MTNHTPEPWSQMGCGIYANKRLIACFGDDDDSGISAEIEQIATTKRAVDCVNACAGINPEAVKDLVAELESLADYLAGQLTAIECPPTDEQSDWPLVHKARAALAKAKLP